ncbi:hypothetical protein AA102526_1520 [Asaia lannensis NBRC 102526]|nr:hypothetical protein AA102526_1520 [Asaia lannensis NBRC 102526]
MKALTEARKLLFKGLVRLSGKALISYNIGRQIGFLLWIYAHRRQGAGKPGLVKAETLTKT